MKVALVHYWLIGMRGGEKVLESLLNIYPDADIYCHVVDRSKLSSKLALAKINATFISKLPFAISRYQNYLPLMPIALEQLDLSGYDLIISSESGPAKGVITRPDAVHICYCHSPMRYVWDMYHDYTRGFGFFKKLIIAILLHYVRLWDYASAARVDHFIANSSYISSRIKKYYGRTSRVINPPVDFSKFNISESVGDYYLCLGQLVSYKRADLAVKAFNLSGKKLIIVGEGEMKDELIRMAGPNVTILGKQSFDSIKFLYANCRALIFPGVEDFGIVPLEAMASGRPVIAYGKGGVLDSIIDGKTGVYFHEQSVDALNSAIDFFELNIDRFNPVYIREHASLFSTEVFEESIRLHIESLMSGSNPNEIN